MHSLVACVVNKDMLTCAIVYAQCVRGSRVPTDASASQHSSVDLVCTAENKVTKVDVEDLISEGSLLMNRSYFTSLPEDICCPTILH